MFKGLLKIVMILAVWLTVRAITDAGEPCKCGPAGCSASCDCGCQSIAVAQLFPGRNRIVVKGGGCAGGQCAAPAVSVKVTPPTPVQTVAPPTIQVEAGCGAAVEIHQKTRREARIEARQERKAARWGN